MKTNIFNVVLYRPEIPPNTGNIARLCVGCNTKLHLIGKLGFNIDEKSVKRAGLDYWEYLNLSVYKNIDEFIEKSGANENNLYLITKFGNKKYTKISYKEGDYFLFGRETKGLPEIIHNMFPNNRLFIPMTNKVRSINLSNSVSIILYEAIRQVNMDFS